MLTKIKTEKILGVDVDVFINSNTGRFVIKLGRDADEREINKPTMAEAIASAQTAIRKMQSLKAVPVTMVGLSSHPLTNEKFDAEAGVYHCLLRGVHTRTSALLMKDPDSEKLFQTDSWHNRDRVVRRLTDDEVENYRQLVSALKVADAALSAFLASVKIDPREATHGADAED